LRLALTNDHEVLDPSKKGAYFEKYWGTELAKEAEKQAEEIVSTNAYTMLKVEVFLICDIKSLQSDGSRCMDLQKAPRLGICQQGPPILQHAVVGHALILTVIVI
jgi:hypothetical protein